jgi:hypothetical protein
VFLLVLLEKNFSERRRKILGGKKYSRERERDKKRGKEEKTPFLFEVFIFCPLLLIFSLLLCARV